MFSVEVAATLYKKENLAEQLKSYGHDFDLFREQIVKVEQAIKILTSDEETATFASDAIKALKGVKEDGGAQFSERLTLTGIGVLNSGSENGTSLRMLIPLRHVQSESDYSGLERMLYEHVVGNLERLGDVGISQYKGYVELTVAGVEAKDLGVAHELLAMNPEDFKLANVRFEPVFSFLPTIRDDGEEVKQSRQRRKRGRAPAQVRARKPYEWRAPASPSSVKAVRRLSDNIDEILLFEIYAKGGITVEAAAKAGDTSVVYAGQVLKKLRNMGTISIRDGVYVFADDHKRRAYEISHAPEAEENGRAAGQSTNRTGSSGKDVGYSMLARMIESGGQTTTQELLQYGNSVAINYLSKAGRVRNVRRGVWEITATGRKYHAAHSS